MADYIAQPDTAVDPDAPVTSDLMYALRDNPIAIAEGASGAPRIADAALGTSVTAAGRNWVAQRVVTSAGTAVGRYVMAMLSAPATSASFGSVRSGSELRAASADGTPSGSGLPGSWVCCGNTSTANDSDRTTLWLRVS